MPRKEWESFQETHYRPHLVVADIDVRLNAPEIEKSLEKLAASLDLAGDYAIRNEGGKICAAFERDLDAEQFARVLPSRGTTRDAEWASRTVSHMDGAAHKRIVAALKQHRLRNPARR
jgi:hypothetical protein